MLDSNGKRATHSRVPPELLLAFDDLLRASTDQLLRDVLGIFRVQVKAGVRLIRPATARVSGKTVTV